MKRALAGAILVMSAVGARFAAAVPTADAPAPDAPLVLERPAQAAEASAAFGKPPGFVVDLFAAEPDVANPVAFSIDERGRVFVCETFRQRRGVSDNRHHSKEWVDADLASQSVEDRLAFHLRLLGEGKRDWERHDDRVRLLVDTDGDGAADQASVFASRFNRVIDGTLAGILARRGDVFVTCIPSLYRLHDADGNGTADTTPKERTVLSTGYGARVSYRGHDLHGLVLGHDGKLYYSIGDRGYRIEHDGRIDTDPGTGAVFRCNPDGSELEVVAHGLRNPQELAFDDLGNLFTVDNNSDAGDRARLVHVLPGAETGWNMAYQYLADRGPWHREKLWHLAHADQPAWILPPVAHVSWGPCGFAAYPGTGLPPHFDGRFMLANFGGSAAGSGVLTFRIQPQAAGFVLTDEERTFGNILATDVDVGPDGAVWIADWVESWEGSGRGRLWRFRPEDQPTAVIDEVRQLLAGDWSQVEASRLVELLGHDDRRLRREAQWELVRRRALAPLQQVASDTVRPVLARVHAVWGLEQLARTRRMDAAVAGLIAASRDTAWEVRMVTARSLGELWPELPARSAVRQALLAGLSDDHPHVRSAAAIALGRLGHRDGDDAGLVIRLVDMAADDIESDPTLRHAIVMGLTGAASPDAIVKLTTHASAGVRLAACLVLRRLADPRIAACLDDSSPRVALEAARAIHDLPIPAALPALAARAATGPAADSFMSRAVSAAERVGSADSAAVLVGVVGRPDASSDVRVMALTALRDWAAPPANNRVTNIWQPHALPRDAAVAKAALEPALEQLLATGARPGGQAALDEPIRAALLATASALGIEAVAPLLVAWCHDVSCSPASRVKALESLAAANDPATAPVAAALVKDDEPLVRAAARDLRARMLPAAEAVRELRAAVSAPDRAERQAAVRALRGIDDPTARNAVQQLVKQRDAGTLDPALELEVNEAAAARLGAVPPPAAPDSDPLAQWRDVLVGGDPARGREVFFTKTAVSCVRCHKVDGQGGDVGPALDGIATRRDRRHLLESIVHPDAQVEERFRTTVILTDAGKTIAGIVTAADDRALTLTTGAGTTETVPLEAIEERTSGPSAMPADLAEKLTRRELRDLVAWLASLKAPDPRYTFRETISREVLENYLARSIHMASMINSEHLDDDLRMLGDLGAKYIGRVALLWWNDAQRADIEKHFARARRVAATMHAQDPEFLLEAGVMETVGPGIDAIPVPGWVFQEFSLPVEQRTFDHLRMMYDDNTWAGHGHGTIPPDISKEETRLWFYYCCRRYIDCGYESIHLGMIGHMNRKDPGHRQWFDLLGRLRAYAKKNARRKIVLFNSQIPYGIVENGRLLLDHHQMQLRPADVADRPEECELRLRYGDTIWQRSRGGITPSGWACDHLPYSAQFDNGYATGTAGQSVGFPYAWGSCEITWFARQPADYRDQWLRYAHDWIRKNDPAGFLQMPGRMPLGEPFEMQDFKTVMYKANTPSRACPRGFGQERAIRDIWAHEGQPEGLPSDTTPPREQPATP